MNWPNSEPPPPDASSPPKREGAYRVEDDNLVEVAEVAQAQVEEGVCLQEDIEAFLHTVSPDPRLSRPR